MIAVFIMYSVSSHACNATRSAMAPLTIVVLVAANAHYSAKPHTEQSTPQREMGQEPDTHAVGCNTAAVV